MTLLMWQIQKHYERIDLIWPGQLGKPKNNIDN
jgi:hypothetical protein